VGCDCYNLTPYQRLANAWNEVMNARADLDSDGFDAATKILTDMDALLFRLQKLDTNTPIPLYTSLCNHWEPSHG
jgi:hypothetical protein